MLRMQLDSDEGVLVTVTVDRPVLARLVREVEAAFDARLAQACRIVPAVVEAPTRDAVLGELLTNRARLRRLLGEDLELRVIIECNESAFEVDACGEVTAESAPLARGITRVDFGEYQVRHGRRYTDALPRRIALGRLGYWHFKTGDEHYVAPTLNQDRSEEKSDAQHAAEDASQV